MRVGRFVRLEPEQAFCELQSASSLSVSWVFKQEEEEEEAYDMDGDDYEAGAPVVKLGAATGSSCFHFALSLIFATHAGVRESRPLCLRRWLEEVGVE